MNNFGAEKFLSFNFLNRFSPYIFPIIIFSLAFCLQYSVALLGLDLHHDLLMFDAARNFYSGQIPYKDFFYQYNLGTVFLHGASLGILGLKIASLKKVTVLFYALIALLIYLSCAIEGSRRSGFLLSILWTLLSPFYMPAMNGYHAWSTIYMMFSCMAGLLCLQLSIRKIPFGFGFLAGIFFSLGFWFKQVAAFQIAAIVTWLVLNIWFSLKNKADRIKYIKIFSGFAIGGLLLCTPFFAYLYAESAISNWWIDAFQFNKYFSADSQNITGIREFLKLLFPIQRDMGYKSSVWAILPITLIVTAFQFFVFKQNFFNLTKVHKISLSLFIFAGLAGWVEYFPLPHPFHTQIFMAPVFVAIGIILRKHPLSFSFIKKHFFVFIVIYIFIGIGGYESYRHIAGLRHKILNYDNDSIEVNLGSSSDGLILKRFDEEKLAIFYQNMMALKTSSKSNEFIPLSVDPLRGLVSGEIKGPDDFKMGLDWTWPNEIVEPGFLDKVNGKILLHKQPVYADSLIFIPGYVPVSILEMQAPISSVHTLYRPEEGVSELLSNTKKNNEILFLTKQDFDLKSRSIFIEWQSGDVGFNLIPIDSLPVSGIKNIHISLMEEKDFPQKISALQFEYLRKAGKHFGGNLPELFRLDNHLHGVLRKDISLDDKKNLAFFMLSRGKLFVTQNRPTYSTTLASADKDKPLIASISKEDSYAKILWSKSESELTRPTESNYKDALTKLFLVIKPTISQYGYKFIVIQVEYRNGQAKNYFYTFLDDKK